MVTDPAPVRNPASDANPTNEPADTDDETLPQWWAERVPTAELQLRTRRFRPGNRGPTVVVRPRGWSQTGRG
jgi:hypothetical protein